MRPDKEKELLRVAFDDLSYALDLGHREDATPAELRRASDVLRRLLLPGKGDNLLRRAAERLQHVFTFRSKDYALALQFVANGKLTFFQRGGAALWGVEYEGVAGGPAKALDGMIFIPAQPSNLPTTAFCLRSSSDSMAI